MKILLTGATGYIGKRLLPVLLGQGHEVICCVRDKKRFPAEGVYQSAAISLLEVDFLKEIPSAEVIRDIDTAYYLIHSMSGASNDFDALEAVAANHFVQFLRGTKVRQIIYLGGITNEAHLSKHLASRKRVDEILHASGLAVTSVKAGIIVGSGSSSFEIMRDLVEKLPVMVTPKWINTRCQPVAIRNVIECLTGVLLRSETYHESYDIGGPDVLTYKEMLLELARVRGLRRYIGSVPVMSPRISSYWLYFVTSTSYRLAVNLVNSMKVEVIAQDDRLMRMLGIRPVAFRDAVQMAFAKIEQDDVMSSWKDPLVSSSAMLPAQIHAPVHGCLRDVRMQAFAADERLVMDTIWSIGGRRGWYYADWLWRLRGIADKLCGGVGLRRGRTSENKLNTGDALDFWRVLCADREAKRLLLYAEMKLPGEAWLEFEIVRSAEVRYVKQTATFRPRGLAGRMYWYASMPFHWFIFRGMLRNIVRYHKKMSASAGSPIKNEGNDSVFC